MRNTDLVIVDIKELVATKGYIYALCLILFEDFHIEIEKIHEVDNKSKLNVKEASLLLGFLVQNKIDFTTPDSPETVIGLKERTYKLMEELHHSYLIPQSEKIKKLYDQVRNGIKQNDSEKEKFDFFVNDGGMVEPMFYSGDGVYDFQYLEYLDKKYKYDREWLLSKKSFDFGDTVKNVKKIRDLLQEKSTKINLIPLKEKESELKEKYKDEDLKEVFIAAEFYQYINLFPPLPDILDGNNIDEQREQNWNSFYENLIDLFVVDRSQFELGEKINSFFNIFSFSPDRGINNQYKGAGYFNILNAKPLIKLDENKYFVPINYLVAEAVYESPYYWMVDDKKYGDQLASHRGKVGEEMAYEFLSQVFGKENTFKSIIVTSKKGERDTDIDVLCLLGSKALCVQVKSKKLTLPARQGDTKKLVTDFTEAVQDAYEQGLISRNKVLEHNAKFYNDKGQEIKISDKITDAYIMGITTENYPTLTHQAYIMLKKEKKDPFPIFLSIFDMEILVHYLSDPYDFLYYIRQRISLMEYFRADEEIVYLGYHLKNKLWKWDDADFVAIDSNIGYLIDRNYYPQKAGYSHLVTNENDPIKNSWKDECFNELCTEIKRQNNPQVTDIIFHLLDLSGDTRTYLVKNIKELKRNTLNDKRQHTMSMPMPDLCICYISLNNNDLSDLEKRLSIYSKVRKYKSKCNTLLGLGSLTDSSNMIDIVIYNNDEWQYDSELELLTKELLDNNTKTKIIRLNFKN